MRTYSVIVVNPLEKCSGDDKPAGMLFQYDYGQKIAIGGVTLPAAYEVHFSNQKLGKSVTVIGDVTGIVDIPDAMLLTGQDVHVWLYLHQGEDDGETVYYARIAVKGRAKPTHETPTPVQQDEITQAIAALNAAVEATGADAAAAEDSAEDAGRAQAAAEAAQDRAEAAQGAAESAQTGAETAQDKAEDAQEAAEGARDRAETAAQLLEDCSAEAETLTAGSAATASYSEGVFHFGIPRGSKGSKGDPGDRGPEGPTGPEGPEGPAGYSPTASVSKSGSTATISITDKTGTTTATVSDGENGAPGQDGYTPQRGTDYWTAADKAEIVAEAEAEFSEDIADIVSDVSQLKDDLSGKAPIILQTASGDIVTVTDGADGMPLSSCVVSVDPVQDLHGQGYPYPAGSGPNIWDEAWEVGGFKDDGTPSTVVTNKIRSTNYIPVTPGAQYYCKNPATATGLNIYCYDTNKAFLQLIEVGSSNRVLTAPADCYYIMFSTFGTSTTTYNHDISINYPATDTAYHPYSNICPITGWTGANIVRNAGNYAAMDSVLTGYALNASGATYSETGMITTDYMPVKQGEDVHFYFVSKQAARSRRVVGYNADKTYNSILFESTWATVDTAIDRTYTIQSGVAFVRASYYSEDTEKSLVNKAYESVYPISWQTAAGTVYGGTVDTRTGVMTVTRAYFDASAWTWNQDGTSRRFRVRLTNYNETPYSEILSNVFVPVHPNVALADRPDYSITMVKNNYYQLEVAMPSTYDLTAFNSFLADVDGVGTHAVIVLEYNTPLTYQLDPVQMTTLMGYNAIWADTGAISVTYPADTQTYVDEAIPAVPVQDVQIGGESILSDGVANIPVATNASLGLVKVESTNGIGIESQNKLYIEFAPSNLIKSATGSYRPITPPRQHEATFYGLAKASGDTTQANSSNAVGTYTDTAKDKILKMLGVLDMIAPYEPSSVASRAISAGECFINAGKLYRATASISVGASFTSANCTQTTLMAEITR